MLIRVLREGGAARACKNKSNELLVNAGPLRRGGVMFGTNDELGLLMINLVFFLLAALR